jgi:serine/threonine protein kinase
VAAPADIARQPTTDEGEAVLAACVEEWTRILQAGGMIDVEDYARRFPANAERLRLLLPTIEMMAELGHSQVRDDSPTRPPADGMGPTCFLLGDFRILREVGRGGMGVVYEAEQLSLRRRVALKVLPFAATLDPRQLQRFQLEARAAACLHHTNIVPIHAVGTERGVPFYAMQFIEGQSIADLIRDLRRLDGLGPADGPATGLTEVSNSSLAARLASANLRTGRQGCVDPSTGPYPDRPEPEGSSGAPISEPFAPTTSSGLPRLSDSLTRSRDYLRNVARLGQQAAEALDHAHARGIVHRDIKPGNLLLDELGNIWVTDFGLALVQGDHRLTRTGDVLGTLRYMSPEQALARRVVLDYRTDVYSLGISLYELLTLEPAFGGQGRQELLRQIASEEPRPPRSMNRAIPAELETVVLKAMEKDPAERYATAQEMADDLGRFLRDDPIRAKRPTPVQRVRRWTRRHRPAVWSAGLSLAVFLLMAVVVLATSNVMISRERDQKDVALKEKDRALGQREAALATAEANLQLARKAVDDVYDQLAGKISDLPQMQSLEQEFLKKALTFYREFAAQKGMDPGIRLGTGRAYGRLGLILYKLNQHQQAEEAISQAIARLEELVAEDPSEPRYRSELAGSYHALGLVLAETKGSQQAEQAHRRAIKLLSELVAEGIHGPEFRFRLATANNSLGTLLHANPREAERAHRDAITRCEKLVAEFPERYGYRGELVRGHLALGRIWAKTGRLLEAEKPVREAIALYKQQAGPLNSSYYRRLLPLAYLELAKVMHSLGRLRDAEDAYRESIALWERYVAGFPRISEYWERLYDCYENLVRLLVQTEHSDEAASICHQALDLYKSLAGQLPDQIADEGVPRIATGLDAVLKNRSGSLDQERVYREVLELSEKLAAQSPTLVGHRFHAAYWHNALGGLLKATGRTPEAANAYRQATVHYRAAIELNPNHVPSLKDLAWILSTAPDSQLRNPREAVLLAERAMRLMPTSSSTRSILGVARYRAGDYRAAIAGLRNWDESGHGGEPSLHAFLLAMAHRQLGERDEARRWYEKAVESMKTRPNDDELLRFRSEAAALLGRPEPAAPPRREDSRRDAEGRKPP